MTRTRKIQLLATWFVMLLAIVLATAVSNTRNDTPPIDRHAITYFSSDDSATAHFESIAQTVSQGKGKKATFDSSYGWNWDHPVQVCDATNNPVWDVAGAVAKWSTQGLVVQLTTDCSTADVVVEQGDANAFCGTNQPIIGCGGADVVNGEPVHGRVVMSQDWADWVYSEPKVGGTVHELGHTLGFGHPATLSNADSIMAVPIPTNSTARTTLSGYDKSGIRYLY